MSSAKARYLSERRNQFRLACARIAGGPEAATTCIRLLYTWAGRPEGPQSPEEWVKAGRKLAFYLGRLGSLLPASR